MWLRQMCWRVGEGFPEIASFSGLTNWAILGLHNKIGYNMFQQCMPVMTIKMTMTMHSGLKWGVRWGVAQIWP